MSGGFGYEERPTFRGGNGYTDNHLAVRDLVEEALRQGAPVHCSGNVTPAGLHHIYECPCRDGGWMMHGAGQREIEPNHLREIVRRNHRKIDQVNRTIGGGSIWSEVHPKMKTDGTYPKEFMLPKTHYEFKAMDAGVLDRILHSYNISDVPNGSSSDQRKSRDQDPRKRKLCRLYEYLGADNLIPKRGEEDQHYKHERYNNW